MSSLQGNKIKNTYQGVLKVADNGVIESNLQQITDGLGNSTGVSLNNQGDLQAQGTVTFGSLADSGENITITKFVDEAEGIANNDNDTSIPTSAAVRDYVDSNITAQDLDISDGTNTGSVDLDSQSLVFTGDAGVSVSVSAQQVVFDSSSLQGQITSNDTDISELQTADITLQANIDAEASIRAAEDSSLLAAINTEITDRISADQAQATALSNEEAARIAADSALQTAINTEATTRAAEDTLIRSDINAEETARINADATLQGNIDAEEAARIAADIVLQTNINTEASNRATADSNLQSQITSNDADITSLDGRLTTAESNISSNDLDISGLDTRLTTAEGNISSNDTDIAALDTRITTAEGNIASNDSDISGLDTRLTTAEGNITTLTSTKQSISEKGQANGYAPLDAGAKVPEANLPDSILGQVQYEGTWDASTNTPTLPDPTTVKGHYYIVEVEGTYLSVTYHVGDWIISNGVTWEKVDNTDAVTSVFGRLGAVIANEADYAAFYAPLAAYNTTASQVDVNTTKLATIETGADVTDATNVAAAGALMSGTAVINDLADVSVPSPSNGQVLSYNSTSGQWEASAAAAAPVDSVNGQTGIVVLDADDIDDILTTNKFTTAADISKLAGIEAGADVTDTENVVAALTAGSNITIGIDGTISATDTNTTYTAGSGLTLAGTEFSHSDTSTAADLAASGRTYVTGLTFDTYGHVTGYTTGTETVVDTNTTYSAGAGIDLVGTTFSHSDTSSQASVNNADGNVIQDVTVDGYGHVTGLNSVNLDSRYYTESEVNTLLAGKLGTTAKAADSNLLDGIDSASFLRGDTTDTFTTLNGSTLTVTGNLGAGTTSPGYKIEAQASSSSPISLARFINTSTASTTAKNSVIVLGATDTVGTKKDVIHISTSINDANAVSGGLLIGTRTSDSINGRLLLEHTGTLQVDGDVVAYSTAVSDQSLKDDVVTIESALDKVIALRGVEYTWNALSRKGQRDLGFIAQEVENVIPEVVREKTLNLGEFTDQPKTVKTIDYEKITAILVEAVKEQQKQIDELKAKLDGITN